MKKYLFLFLLAPVLVNASTTEIRFGGNLLSKGKFKNEFSGNTFSKKDIVKNGFGASIEARDSIDDFEIGLGIGLKYNSLKSIENSKSKNIVSVPIYFVGKGNLFNNFTDGKVAPYIRYELGYAFRNGNLKWENQKNSGEIKFGGGVYASAGLGIQYKNFTTDLSYNWEGIRVKRNYKTAAYNYSDKFTLHQGFVTLNVGSAFEK